MPQTQLQLFNSVVGGKFFLLKLVCTKALYLLLIRCQACSKDFILYNAVISSFCSFYLFRIALVFRFSGTADTYPESMSNLKLHANPALNWSLEKLPWHSIARQRTYFSVCYSSSLCSSLDPASVQLVPLCLNSNLNSKSDTRVSLLIVVPVLHFLAECRVISWCVSTD